jgi:hypothetical protein
MEKPIHVTMNEPTPNIIEDKASVSAPMKKPIKPFFKRKFDF